MTYLSTQSDAIFDFELKVKRKKLKPTSPILVPLYLSKKKFDTDKQFLHNDENSNHLCLRANFNAFMSSQYKEKLSAITIS